MVGWVTVFGQVNDLGAEPGTLRSLGHTSPLCIGWIEYPAKAAE